MEKSKQRKLIDSKVLFAIISLIVAVLLATTSLFAWFTMNDKLFVSGYNSQIVSGADVGMDIIFGDNAINVVKFDNGMPGSTYRMTIILVNNTQKNRTVNIDFVNIKSSIYKFDGPIKTLDTTKSMLNVFALKREGETSFTSFEQIVYEDDTYIEKNFFDKEELKSFRVFSGLIVPPSSADAPITRVVFEIRFTEEIINHLGQPLVVLGDDGLPVFIDINDYQGQFFKIGKIVNESK